MYNEFLITVLVFRFFAETLGYNNSDDVKLKIIGGFSVRNRSDFSYQVSLRYAGNHFCGGSLIRENLVITAAHCCFHDKKLLRKHNLKVVAGDLNIRKSFNSTESRSVSRIYVHPRYNEEYIENDIAIWKVSTPFPWNEDIQPIEITFRRIKVNTRCNVSGWGITDTNVNVISSNLKYVEVPVIAKTKCRRFYPEVISKDVICAGSLGKDSCQGDSGGALVCNKTLAGIVSYGENCGVYPGVYTDVYAYRSWIRDTLETINSSSNISSNFILYIFLSLSMIAPRI